MAREPVAKIKREPVTIEAVEKAIDAREGVADPVVASAVTRIKRAANPIDEGGWRACAREDCGVGFKPEPPSRAFCSDECAQINFYREHGMTAKADEMVAKEKRDGNGAIVRTTRGSNPEKEALKDGRYGPMRTVGEVLKDIGTRQRVRFTECKHEGSVGKGTQRARCRACKNEAAKSATTVDTAKKVVHREPVKREPVTREVPVHAQVEQFVKKGQAAQKAVNAEIAKAKRQPVAKKKPVAKKVTRKPVKSTTKRKGKR